MVLGAKYFGVFDERNLDFALRGGNACRRDNAG